MRHRVVLHPFAQQELIDLYTYIDENGGPDRAGAFVNGIREYCLGLSTFPKRGTVRDDIMPGLRIVGYRRSVSIAFSVTDDAVLILGFFYGGRNITPAVLSDRG